MAININAEKKNASQGITLPVRVRRAMFFVHLRLLIEKSLRYAWRRRLCRCCPKFLFEFSIPIVCLLLLCLLRWIHTPSTRPPQTSSRPQLTGSTIISSQDANDLWTYRSIYQCPAKNRTIEIVSPSAFTRLQRLCRNNSWNLSPAPSYERYLLLNQSRFIYRCRYNDRHWCESIASKRCSTPIDDGWKVLIRTYLILETLLHRPSQIYQITISTWPCSAYYSDDLYELAERFTLIIIILLIDGCILFGYHLLFQSLIDEKQQKIVELLRLLSIHPLLNSFAWFLRVFLLQILINIVLIIVWKLPINGSSYFPYVSIGYLIPTIFLWTIQVLSRAVLVGHAFDSILKASLWSWLIYLISFWVATSSTIELPTIVHLIASAWFPFYSIKRMIIVLIRINSNLARYSAWNEELLFIWFSMIIGIVVMWLLAIYIEPIRPGKHRIARSWLWPLDLCRRRKEVKNESLLKSSSDPQLTIHIENLTKTFGRSKKDQQIAVDHISLDLEESKIYGLIGPNGSGKTTTMEMITGLLAWDSGTIEIVGQNLVEHRSTVRSCIGYCPQEDMLFPYLTVQEQLEFYARVRTYQGEINQQEIDHLLTMMDMKKDAQRLCHTLSGGMQRKLSILCAFVGDVHIILLDEPSSSLDPVARRLLCSWLRQCKLHRILLISSHLLDEIEELCDSIIILDSGQLRAQGSILQLKEQYSQSDGDRFQLETIPSYVPQQWINDQENRLIEIPTVRETISLLRQLEDDHIRYTLKNRTLDEIFLQLTSTFTTLSTTAMESQIQTLFHTHTQSQRFIQQFIGVFFRRCQVLFRQARLLPVVILLYFLYALLPTTISSWNLTSAPSMHYIISSPVELRDRFHHISSQKTFLPPISSSIEFQQQLLSTSDRLLRHHRSRRFIGLRVVSPEHLQCYLSSPLLTHLIAHCLPAFSLFSNRSISSLEIPTRERGQSASILFDPSANYLCLFTLPPAFHSAIIILSLILVVCAAFIIQDYRSGLHSYSLIHGLHSWIHWLVIFLSDLILCLLWFSIFVLIARFAHAPTFDTRFFLLIPLLFLVNLPFIYLLAKLFHTPLLGATAIYILLQFAHLFNTLQIFIELFRQYQILSFLIPILRWFLILVFPNVNVFTLIVAILRPSSCPFDGAIAGFDEFSHERYRYKIPIHMIIFLCQFCFYWILLILMDMRPGELFQRKKSSQIDPHKEDPDVDNERHRVESMTDEARQHEALVVDNLTKYFHRPLSPVINRLTFAVPRRQCFGLLGFNGSGKSTTFRILVGELRASSGHVYRKNTESIGYCPQQDISFAALTVLQSIDYICRLHGLQPSQLNELLLAQFQLKNVRHRLVSHLSGGTRRRLHLALCLIGSPTLLLLDEPTAKVDPLLRSHLRHLLKHRPEETSIVFASHSMSECEQLCDRLTILVQGHARCLGSPDHLKDRYGRYYRVRLELQQEHVQIPPLIHIDHSNEYLYPNENLSELFILLERLVHQNQIAPTYTVQLTSLEQIFLTLQHPIDELSISVK